MNFKKRSFTAPGVAVIAMFGFISLACAPARAEDQNASVSDDAGPAPADASAAVSRDGSSSFPGTGRTLPFGATDDALANFPAGDTAADRARILSAKPRMAPGWPESVIGSDQRVRVTPTTTYPARATAFILFSDSVGGGTFSCTGWFVNKNTIVTAGHCVADGGSGRFFPRSTYRIYPGRNAGTSPYGSCTAKRLSTVAGWLRNGSDLYDFAAIKLNCNIGNTVGWYGYTVHANPLNVRVAVQGYPGDKPSGTQWKSTDKIRVVQANRLFYQADTAGGESGSAVWYNKSATCRPCAIAIHAYGTGGSPPYSTNNHGRRITSDVVTKLNTWKNAP